MLIPVRQGDVDALCGIYALMNLRRLQDEVKTYPTDVDEGCLLSEALFFLRSLRAIQAHPDGDLLGTITEGLEPEDMEWLSKRLDGPRLAETTATFEAVRKAVRQKKGVILFFEGKDFKHYSVASSVDSKADSITLFDSWEFERFADDTLIRAEGKPSVKNVKLTKVLVPSM